MTAGNQGPCPLTTLVLGLPGCARSPCKGPPAGPQLLQLRLTAPHLLPQSLILHH